MPIRPNQRGFYPIDWRELSRVIRFERAGGCCERCGRPHGERVWHLGERVIAGRSGIWWDGARWRDQKGRVVRLPPLHRVRAESLRQGRLWPQLPQDERIEAAAGLRCSRVSLACCHLDHDPSNNSASNLAALCQRCHLKHDAVDNLARRHTNRWAQLTHGMMPLALG